MMCVDRDVIYFRVLSQHDALRVNELTFSCEDTGGTVKVNNTPALGDRTVVYIQGLDRNMDNIMCHYSVPNAEQVKNNLIETIWRLCQNFRENKTQLGFVYSVNDVYQF
jgi:hypothetical protein